MNVLKINNAFPNSNLGFRADLKVNKNIYEANLNTGAEKLKNVIGIFRKKLAMDPLNASDVVELRKIGKDRDVVSVGCREVVTTETQYGTSHKVHNYFSDYAFENLEIAINKNKTGFYFNNNRSEEEIAEDMYNAYKYVRYLEHYKK